MTKDEADKCIGKLVRVRRNGAAKNLMGAWLIEVGRKTAIIKPFKHKHRERVRLKDIRYWKSANPQPETKQNAGALPVNRQ